MNRIIVDDFEYSGKLLALTEIEENLRGLSVLANWYYRKTDDYDLTDELPCVLRHFAEAVGSISNDIGYLHTALDNMALKADKLESSEGRPAAGEGV